MFIRNCWVLGQRGSIWPAAPEYKYHHDDGIQCDHKLGDGFKTPFDARGPLTTERHRAHCFQRQAELSVRSPAFFSSWHGLLGLWVTLPLRWQH